MAVKKIRIKRIRIPGTLESELLIKLTALVDLVAKYAELQILKEARKTFCNRCYAEVPSGHGYCRRCELQVALEERIQSRILPDTRTVGGMAVFWES
jgi:ribosomal protein L40E